MEGLKNVSSLQRKRLYEEVSRELKKAIFSGGYQVGDKLPPETELAKLFQVSRSVIREAIRYLEFTGLVTVKQGATGGAFVSEMNTQIIQTFMKDFIISGKISFSQISDVRMYLDPEISRLAAIHATETDLKELKKSVYLPFDTSDTNKILNDMARFHELLGKASHNPFYSIISDSITNLTTGITAEFTETIDEPERLRIQSEHEAIYEVVAAGDPERAVQVTREHTHWMDKRMIEREKIYMELIRK